MQVSEGQQVQIVQAAAAQGQAQTAQAQGQTMQVMQQIITNTGEIQQIPVRNQWNQTKEKMWAKRFDWRKERLAQIKTDVCSYSVWHCSTAQTWHFSELFIIFLLDGNHGTEVSISPEESEWFLLLLSRGGKWLWPLHSNDLCSKPNFVSPVCCLSAGATKHGPATVHPSSSACLRSASGPRTDSDSRQHPAGNQNSNQNIKPKSDNLLFSC